MNKFGDDIFNVVGNTPLVRIQRITPDDGARIYAKLEFMNPTRSLKDRVALAMVENAEKQGKLRPGGIIVEPTSGNLGIALASLGAVRGYRVILVVPEPTIYPERADIIRAFGAELILTPEKDGFEGAIQKAKELAVELDAFMPNEFSNPQNYMSQEATGCEIVEQVPKPPSVFVMGVGSGGAITGIGKALKKHFPEIKIVMYEPATTAFFSKGQKGTHRISGIGPDFHPPIFDLDLVDEIMTVTDEIAWLYTRRLAKEEGMLCGASSGAAIWVANQIAMNLSPNDIIVTMFADSGERYFSRGVFSHDR